MEYCFDSSIKCASLSCSLPVSQHEHTFVHGSGRVRVRISERAQSYPTHPSGGADSVLLRTRCLTCARITNSGSVLSRDALSVSFGRFLQSLFYERTLLSQDPCCRHPVHAQLHTFSLRCVYVYTHVNVHTCKYTNIYKCRYIYIYIYTNM
jgi:hypothetical protein